MIGRDYKTIKIGIYNCAEYRIDDLLLGATEIDRLKNTAQVILGLFESILDRVMWIIILWRKPNWSEYASYVHVLDLLATDE